ncbi:MAG: DUF4402 domain-containing protein [Alphaproteobacteria bacterium]|nr:DUF4402 domain-containing protein [Alphaproteobacteria bacterium]
MKKLLTFACILAMSVNVANAITVTGDASVNITATLAASQTTPMNFGDVTPTASADTVVLSPAGTATSGTLGLAGSTTAGEFAISGSPDTVLTVSFGAGSVTDGSNTMNLSDFTTSPTGASIVTDSSGDLTLMVGATLNVGASQVAGAYTGTYTITISY